MLNADRQLPYSFQIDVLIAIACGSDTAAKSGKVVISE